MEEGSVMKVSFFFKKKVVVKPLKCYKMHQRAPKVQNFSEPEPSRCGFAKILVNMTEIPHTFEKSWGEP